MPPHGNITGNNTPATVTVRTAAEVAAIIPPPAGLGLLTAREVVAAAVRVAGPHEVGDPSAAELVFVDAADRFHRALQRIGRSRRAAYRRLGWRPAAGPAGADQLRRYLARQPHGGAIRTTLVTGMQTGAAPSPPPTPTIPLPQRSRLWLRDCNRQRHNGCHPPADRGPPGPGRAARDTGLAESAARAEKVAPAADRTWPPEGSERSSRCTPSCARWGVTSERLPRTVLLLWATPPTRGERVESTANVKTVGHLEGGGHVGVGFALIARRQAVGFG